MFYRNSVDLSPTSGDVLIDKVATPIKAIRVGIAGDLVVQLSKDPDNTPVTFKNVQAGEILLIRADAIIDAGTTANNIIGLW